MRQCHRNIKLHVTVWSCLYSLPVWSQLVASFVFGKTRLNLTNFLKLGQTAWVCNSYEESLCCFWNSRISLC